MFLEQTARQCLEYINLGDDNIYDLVDGLSSIRSEGQLAEKVGCV